MAYQFQLEYYTTHKTLPRKPSAFIFKMKCLMAKYPWGSALYVLIHFDLRKLGQSS